MDNRVKAPKKRLGLNNKSIKVRSSSKIPEFDKKCVDKKSYGKCLNLFFNWFKNFK